MIDYDKQIKPQPKHGHQTPTAVSCNYILASDVCSSEMSFFERPNTAAGLMWTLQS